MASTDPNSKECKACAKPFLKRKRDSRSEWEGRNYCSITCANRSKFTPTSPESRFWKFVPKKPENVCWEWKGGLDNHGYGMIAQGTGLSPIKAHRLSWIIRYGAIPDGLSICHACDNPACVNPKHLMLGSQMANALDAAKKGRLNPASRLNLCPGRPGFHGAGPDSNKEISYGLGQ